MTRILIKPGEEKTIACDRVLCYFTGSKWKNVYVVEEGLVTFSVQQLGRNTAKWVDAYLPASAMESAE